MIGALGRMCIDCLHFRDVIMNAYPFRVECCAAEMAVERSDGTSLYRKCSVMRDNDGPCGQEGLLFTEGELK